MVEQRFEYATRVGLYVNEDNIAPSSACGGMEPNYRVLARKELARERGEDVQ